MKKKSLVKTGHLIWIQNVLHAHHRTKCFSSFISFNIFNYLWHRHYNITSHMKKIYFTWVRLSLLVHIRCKRLEHSKILVSLHHHVSGTPFIGVIYLFIPFSCDIVSFYILYHIILDFKRTNVLWIFTKCFILIISHIFSIS